MCRNSKWITNKYNGQSYWVECGHCKACLQKKAAKRVKRINHATLAHPFALFCHLTYDDDHVPYIKSSELKSELERLSSEKSNNICLNIYRSFGYRRRIVKTLTSEDFLVQGNTYPDWSKYVNDLLPFLRCKVRSRNVGSFHRDCVGVLWLRDVQNFFKRLERYCFRHGFRGKYQYFYATEYGGLYKRPHIHFLLFCDPKDDAFLRRAVISCWKNCDMSRSFRQFDGRYRKPIEVAKNPAKYVASYVNSRDDVSPFLRDSKPFTLRYRFSNGLGCDFKEFLYDSVLQKVESRHTTFNIRKVVQGVSTICTFPVPNYVLSRYWPKFKGYSNLLPYEVERVAFHPFSIYKYRSKLGLTFEECFNICRTILKIKSRYVYNESFPWSENINREFDYAKAYVNVWKYRALDAIRQSYDDVKTTIDLFEHFNNVQDYIAGRFYHESLTWIPSPKFVDSNPNNFVRTRSLNDIMVKNYESYVKHHKIKSQYYEKLEYE